MVTGAVPPLERVVHEAFCRELAFRWGPEDAEGKGRRTTQETVQK